MARLFDDASNEYLIKTPAILTSVPITMACWFNSNDITVSQILMAISDDAADSDYHLLATLDNIAGNPLYIATARSSAAFAQTALGYSINTWHHACGIFAAVDDRRVYLDGGNKATNGDSRTPVSLDNTTIGILQQFTPFGHMSGLIAEAAIWNIALTDAEVLILANGYSPLFVHPQNLVAYWPLIRGLNDRVGGYNLTATGTIASPHCRIILPSGPF